MVYVKFKRLMDCISSFFLFFLLLIPMVIIAILTTIFIREFPIFKQKRVGKNEKIFMLYKFKSMKEMYDGDGKLLADDLRISTYGKLLRSSSLDELPQLINIFRGDMSFVGPRPLLVEYLDKYTEQERMRHRVLPGLTGLAQISGRNSITWAEKFELDIYYVKNISLLMDFRILILTLKKVISSDGISTSASITPSKYLGSSNDTYKK